MIKKLKKAILVIILSLFFSFSMKAQNDVILKVDGSEMQGKITKMNKDDVMFIYQNETIEYIVSKTDILKITFSSGRIEFFNKTQSKQNLKLEDHHNRVAILPFGYIKDQETSNVIMTKKIQQETYTIYKKKAVILMFQDPTTTNALLSKAGIHNNNIEGYTMGEICNILNVEYIIQGLVSVEKSSLSHYSNTSTNSKSSNDVYVNKKGNIVGDIWNDKKHNSTSSTFGSTVQNYSTNITMNVFNDKGDNIFSKEHVSFWQTQDAYKTTLTYLAKRTPIYKR